MRKPNFELNQVKLQQKQIQYAAIEKQLTELKNKVDSVTERLNSKHEEIEAIKTLLTQTGTVTPAVSE
jgi:peptidoglycan hydrolase CwlO-like protein